MSAQKNLLFARRITSPQLAEYANSFAMRVVWVQIYTTFYCVQHIDQDVTDIYFMQTGPFDELVAYLAQRGITMHLINTEQMSRLVEQKNANDSDDAGHDCETAEQVPFPFDMYVFRYLQGPQPICASVTDYSAENLRLLETSVSACVDLRIHCFTPNVSHPPPTTSAVNGAVFVGDASSRYRKHILDQLPETRILSQTFGAKRDGILQACKVLLNVHYGPTYCIFEELRCLPCILSKIIVVSEDSRLDKAHPMSRFIIFAPYHKLVTKVKDVLQNYEAYFYKLFIAQSDSFEKLTVDIQRYQATVNTQHQQRHTKQQ